jgi:hypothetical protein
MAPDAEEGRSGRRGGLDGQYLFLAVGDRQRMTPAQDPDQPVGKILRLTLDGKPAPGNPNFGKTGAATIPLIDPPSDTEVAKTAKVVSTYTFPTPNMTPAETWASGVRTPYGLAFSPNGELWEVEHGPRSGDELNLIGEGELRLAARLRPNPTACRSNPHTADGEAGARVPVIAPQSDVLPARRPSRKCQRLRQRPGDHVSTDGHGGAKPLALECAQRIAVEQPRWLTVMLGAVCANPGPVTNQFALARRRGPARRSDELRSTVGRIFDRGTRLTRVSSLLLQQPVDSSSTCRDGIRLARTPVVDVVPTPGLPGAALAGVRRSQDPLARRRRLVDRRRRCPLTVLFQTLRR